MMTGTKVTLWGTLGVYLLLVATYAVYMAVLLRAQAVYEANPRKDSFGPLWCGNTVTDPLTLMLNWGTPLALLACVGLFVQPQNETRLKSRMIAGVLFLLPTTSLLGFAVWIFHGPWLGGTCRVAEVVWWMFGI
jgi:hypothetical protein